MVLMASIGLALPQFPAGAQLLGPVERTVGGLADTVTDTLSSGLGATERLAEDARDLTRARLRGLLRANSSALEADRRGFPVVRGEVVALSPSAASLAKAQSAGFAIARSEVLEALGVTLVTLRTPEGLRARDALAKLRKLDPAGSYDLNHIYIGAGQAVPVGNEDSQKPTGGRPLVGLIDRGAGRHPALDGLIVEQRGFAPGGVVPGGHGTAVASLLVGRDGRFRGAGAGLPLLVADVYGDGPTGGSAQALARALAWMAAREVPVVNISLVGPPNLLVRTSVTAVQRRGLIVVAAVGNDGPAAAPLYPAAYPGVVAVTGVDSNNRVLIEAGRGPHVDFAAPGGDMAAAAARGGYSRVRGTSFATPLVAGRLAAMEGSAVARIERAKTEAVDLGRKGADSVYGMGLLCGKCRNMVN